MIKSYGELGLQVHITEIDISCTGCSGNNWSDNNIKQAQIYKKALEACIVDNPGVCTAFLTWGITDEHTWKGVWNHPLPLDENYRKKPAYTKMNEVLQAEKTRREGEESRR
jgi:endo-1,4-beta-xylanase